MEDNLNQALVGTDAIKAFLEQFDSLDGEFKRIVVEELLLCLIGEQKDAKIN